MPYRVTRHHHRLFHPEQANYSNVAHRSFLKFWTGYRNWPMLQLARSYCASDIQWRCSQHLAAPWRWNFQKTFSSPGRKIRKRGDRIPDSTHIAQLITIQDLYFRVNIWGISIDNTLRIMWVHILVRQQPCKTCRNQGQVFKMSRSLQGLPIGTDWSEKVLKG